MAERTIVAPGPPGSTPVSNGLTGRVVRRRRSLPGGRAVAGAFLVTLAAVGTFAGYTKATADTRVRYIAASHDLTIGQRINSGDLAYARANLPAFLAARAYRTPGPLVGAVVVGPIARGELVQSSSVLRRPGASVGREISFPVETARALDGHLQPGEYVDLLATYGTGSEAYTVAVVRSARVVDVSTPKGGLGDSRNQIVTLSVTGSEQALAVAHSVNAGSITLVRSADGAGTISSGPSSYRSPAPTEPAASSRPSP